MSMYIRDASTSQLKQVMTLDDQQFFTDAAGEKITQTTTLRTFVTDDFGGNALDLTKWDVFDGGFPAANVGPAANPVAQAAIGSGITGITHSVSASALAIVMGTTANAEKLFLSKQTICGTEDIMMVLSLSQRLAQNSFQIGLVEVDPTTGFPLLNPSAAGDFTNRVTAEFGQVAGGTNTQISLRTLADSSPAESNVAGSGLATYLINTQEFLLQVRAEDVHLHAGTINSAAAKLAAPLRVSDQVPNDTKLYKLAIRVRNIGAPGSSTTFTLNRILCQDHQATAVSILEGPGGQAGSQGMPVNLVGTTTVAGTVSNQPSQPNNGYLASSTPLSASGSVSSSGFVATLLTNRVLAQAYADQPGTIYVDQFVGSNWLEVNSSAAVQGSTGYRATLDQKLMPGLTYRFRYGNGATAQTSFNLFGQFGV